MENNKTNFKKNKQKQHNVIKKSKPINRKGVVMFGDRYVDMERVLVPRTNKKVKDFINELEPNFERILLYARNNGEKPFASVEHLKKWLIGNQEDYPKFSNDIFFYSLWLVSANLRKIYGKNEGCRRFPRKKLSVLPVTAFPGISSTLHQA